MKNFSNLIQLLDYFKEDKTCTDYLELKRWNGTPCCNHCGSIKVWRTNRGFKCGEKSCNKKFTVLTGTIFENTKIKLRVWFGAMYLCMGHKKGISSYQLAKDLGLTQKTAWFLIHRIRETAKEVAPQKLNNIVEIDETFIGGNPKNKHESKINKNERGKTIREKQPVLGILERGGKVRLFPIQSLEKEKMFQIIDDNVEANSQVCTDEYRIYKALGLKYNHTTVNHSKKEFVNGNITTNSIEGFFSILKRGIYGIYHQVSKKHIARYCNEFAYRFNTRDLKDSDRFVGLFEQINTRLSYKTLIA